MRLFCRSTFTSSATLLARRVGSWCVGERYGAINTDIRKSTVLPAHLLRSCVHVYYLVSGALLLSLAASRYLLWPIMGFKAVLSTRIRNAVFIARIRIKATRKIPGGAVPYFWMRFLCFFLILCCYGYRLLAAITQLNFQRVTLFLECSKDYGDEITAKGTERKKRDRA